jgi:hypothetical protein
VLRVAPRPHGVWELAEPNRPDRCLEGDYLTSRGHYLDRPSTDPADLPLATVLADQGVNEISVELTVEVQTRDLVFQKLVPPEYSPLSWFRRETINKNLIARRLIELAQGGAALSETAGQTKVRLGTATLYGKRRTHI